MWTVSACQNMRGRGKRGKEERTEILTNGLFLIPENARHKGNIWPLTSSFPQASTGCPWERLGDPREDMLGLFGPEAWEMSLEDPSVLWAIRAQGINWLLWDRQKTCSGHRSFFDLRKRPQLLENGKKHLHLYPGPCPVARKRLATSGRGLRIRPPTSTLCWHWMKPPKTNLEACMIVFFLLRLNELYCFFFFFSWGKGTFLKTFFSFDKYM